MRITSISIASISIFAATVCIAQEQDDDAVEEQATNEDSAPQQARSIAELIALTRDGPPPVESAPSDTDNEVADDSEENAKESVP